MDDLFGVPWADVGRDQVETFLGEADDEGLLWEAKGTRPNAGSVRKSVCGFANSERGGYLILGAERDESGRWSLPGLAFDAPEPGTWLSDTITGGLRPWPAFDIRVWGHGSRSVAVIRVEPLTGAPCVTADGRVYQRVTGKTPPVTDPAVLARLFERGEAARSRALEGSQAAAERVSSQPQAVNLQVATLTVFGFGLHAAEHAEGLRDRLFSDDYTEMVQRVAVARLLAGHAEPAGAARLRFEQDAVWASISRSLDSEPTQYQWAIRAAWDGSVGIACFLRPNTDNLLGISILFDEIVMPAWGVAVEVVSFLGGRGDAHLHVRHRATEPRIVLESEHEELLPTGTQVNRWVPLTQPTPEALTVVRQEIIRALGFPAWRTPEAKRVRGP